MSNITNDYNGNKIREAEKIRKLDLSGLKINNKTERYTIDKSNNEWKKCKLLGSFLDTCEEVKRRKVLATNAARKLELYLTTRALPSTQR